MIATPVSFPTPANAIASGPSNFLSKYTMDVPDAIASLAFSNVVTQLDASYQPGCFDVVCGRGKGSYNRPGNKHFRSLVAAHIGDYQRTKSKVDKSAVLNGIVDKIRTYNNPNTGLPAQFVRFTKSEGWSQIGDDHAREKVGHAMREAVADAKAVSSNSRAPVSKQTMLSDSCISLRHSLMANSVSIRRESLTFDSVIGLEIFTSINTAVV